MYPNPQDAIAIPGAPALAPFEQHAADLIAAARRGAADAFRAWAPRWTGHPTESIERFARESMTRGEPTLADAQLVVARLHGFASWALLSMHMEGLADPRSLIAHFETAADAIVGGDAATLQRLLREQPALVRARSTREHAATLLHYVAANGVENYRQKTPPNIVSIAAMLMDAGAEVDAEASIYDGRCTTLGLAATSVHPEAAGVQPALMQALLDRGAAVDHPSGVGRDHAFVNGCLANGRPAAAAYLAARGARVDLAGAAGLGRLDLVAPFFEGERGRTMAPTPEQLHAAVGWACAYGHIAVVEFLLDRGVAAGAAIEPGGRTSLHAAALGGHADIVRLLLDRRAAVDTIERTYQGTPLDWALHGWSTRTDGERATYYEVVALLVAAGAPVNPAWIDDSAEPTPFARQLRADTRMLSALRGNR
jgi:hypothetical protein